MAQVTVSLNTINHPMNDDDLKAEIVYLRAELRRAERSEAELASFVRVVGEELVSAGLPVGDRSVILENVRAMCRVLAPIVRKPTPAHRTMDDDDESRTIAMIHPASPKSVRAVLTQPVSDDGRSDWVWLRLPNGDLILGATRNSYAPGSLCARMSNPMHACATRS